MKKEKMDVLLVGPGGREHSLAWKLRQSPRLGKLWIAPGNGGTGRLGENIPIGVTEIYKLREFALKEKPGLTIVGSDEAIGRGITDLFQSENLRIFAPTKNAAIIETSKLFAKRLMERAGISTAHYVMTENRVEAMQIAEDHFNLTSEPLVYKADGLALGKGSYVCKTHSEALKAIDEIMLQRLYGSSGDRVLIEDYIDGPEVSIHAFSDGDTFRLFPSSQDHKPVLDGDTGLNGGGSGVIAPVPWFKNMHDHAHGVVKSILWELSNMGRPFTGVLYPGLKVSSKGTKVIEVNARFGDPETEAYMRLLKTDLLDIADACVDGRLDKIEIEWHPGFAAGIVMMMEGYPRDYKKGVTITGIDDAERLPGIVVFHMGTTIENVILKTSGGRVLCVTAVGDTLQESLDRAYRAVKLIHFEGRHYRKDIGAKSLALARELGLV